MKRTMIALLALAALVAPVVPAIAHHAFSAEFDNTKRREFKGFVTKVEWTNPHVWFYINVIDAVTGKGTRWGFEMGPPHGLQGQGWTRETMKVGDEVIVNASLAKDGSNRANASTVVLAKTGLRMGAASSENDQK
jgi:hypothetical protein